MNAAAQHSPGSCAPMELRQVAPPRLACTFVCWGGFKGWVRGGWVDGGGVE